MQEFEFRGGEWKQLSNLWNNAIISAYASMIKCNAIAENVFRTDNSQVMIRKPKDLDELVTGLTTVSDIDNSPEGFKKYMKYLNKLYIQSQLILDGESHFHYSLRKLSLPCGKRIWHRAIKTDIMNYIKIVTNMSTRGWPNTLSFEYPAVKNPDCKVVLLLNSYGFISYSQFQSRSEFEMLGKYYLDALQNTKLMLTKPAQ